MQEVFALREILVGFVFDRARGNLHVVHEGGKSRSKYTRRGLTGPVTGNPELNSMLGSRQQRVTEIGIIYSMGLVTYYIRHQ